MPRRTKSVFMMKSVMSTNICLALCYYAITSLCVKMQITTLRQILSIYAYRVYILTVSMIGWDDYVYETFDGKKNHVTSSITHRSIFLFLLVLQTPRSSFCFANTIIGNGKFHIKLSKPFSCCK